MSDLVERLRRCPHSPLSDPGDDLWNGRVCVRSECVREREAADEIERLHKELWLWAQAAGEEF